MLSTLTLADSAAVDHTFNLRGSTQNGASYVDAASSLSEPVALVVNHKLVAAGSKGSDRHTAKMQLQTSDSLGNPLVVTAELSLAVPRDAAVTATEALDIAIMLRNYVSQANITNLIAGITP
jgi:hypothetical protein